MELDIGCRFVFDLPAWVHGVLMVEPHLSELERVVSARRRISPEADSRQYTDSFGNQCRRLTLRSGPVEIEFAARVEAADQPDPINEDARNDRVETLPDDALQFLIPSRYCESDQLVEFAWSQFGPIDAGWPQVQAICDWVHHSIEFDYAKSSPSYSATSVLEGRVGVCRDFTHLAIALCRAMNVPARYVFGYLPDIDVPDPGVPMDFCAWMEVYLGDRWYTFDPRNNQRRIGRVVVGRGRDAADVAMVTTFGAATLVDMTVLAERPRVDVGAAPR